MREYYYLNLICGTNGTGKTTMVIDMIEKLNQRTLIINPSEEYKWNKYERVKYSDAKELRTFTGIKQITPRDDFDADDEELYRDILRTVYYNYSGGTLVIDDARMFINANVGNLVGKFLVKRRQKRLDIFCVFHSINQIPPKFFDHGTHLILFKTNEDWKESLRKIPGSRKEEVAAALERINKQSNNLHYHEIIQF